MVKRNDVNGFLFPLPWVWFPNPLNTETSGCRKMLGWVGSSQHNGIVDLVKSVTMNSPDDCDTICIPISLPIKRNAVDFPLAVSPTAVGTGHAPLVIGNIMY